MKAQKVTRNSRCRMDAVRRPAGLAAAGVLMLFTALPGQIAWSGARSDLCRMASSVAVGKALHANIVRAEAPEGSDPGCDYFVKGTPANSTSNHAISMANSMGGAQIDPQAAKAMSGFVNSVLGDASAKEQTQEPHPGEIPVLVFSVSTGDAQEEMNRNRDTMTRLSPVTPVPGLGEDAFETSQSMLMVRKGDKFIRFIYTQCNCSSRDVIPLAKQIVAGL